MTEADPKGTPEPSRPDCWSCHYFAISWDPRRPYACKLMGFKSKITPCLEVVAADGRVCMGFTPKQEVSKEPAIQEKTRVKPRGRLVNVRV